MHDRDDLPRYVACNECGRIECVCCPDCEKLECVCKDIPLTSISDFPNLKLFHDTGLDGLSCSAGRMGDTRLSGI